MNRKSFIGRAIEKFELWYHSEDSFHVAYSRKYLNRANPKIGEVITCVFGGAFNPAELWKFKFLGEYKGRKIFKELK